MMGFSAAPLAVATATALAAALSAGCTWDRDAGGAMNAVTRPHLSVLYSADVRGRYAGVGTGAAARGGLARRATLVDQARLQADAVVQVDAGNLLPVASDAEVAVPASLSLRAHMILTAYRRMGMNAVVPGQRELALGVGALKALLAETKLHMLAANVVAGDGQRLFDGDRVIDAGGHRVGIFGVVDLSGDAAASLPRWGFVISDAGQAARAAAAALRARGAQFLIAVVHADRGGARAREILKAAGLIGGAADVDVVVVGGDDPSLPGASPAPTAPANVSRPALLRGGAFASTLGRLDVRWPTGGGPPRMDDRLLDVTGDVPEQWGVALIGRVVTTHVVDNGRLANEMPPGATDQERRDAFEKWDYGSTAACAACHQQQEAQWQTTDHAHALETLTAKGHDREPGCLGCHMTGFLGPGGTRNLKTAKVFFPNVGCESCHGPSVEHVRGLDKKRGTSRKVSATVCLGCHTPDQNLGPFDFAAALKEVLGPGHGMPEAKPGASSAPAAKFPHG